LNKEKERLALRKDDEIVCGNVKREAETLTSGARPYSNLSGLAEILLRLVG